ncbi:ATP-grasp domain-containing protein [Methylomonas sp. LL1]|uniref:ATP-grasp domain-containing protein n=1 Tax=Methylomonas sp. LL1 TaxID=2785785 RepID=UPI0018C412E0|nr:ATP-grasp domain-containing protein [Methylomonas sp. LL1]QPK64129.1 ATP-grasp domain-containing protein [Methylomonas sp. LL1]
MDSLNLPSKLLVIAQSARMLAQLAANAGFMPFVIDCFGDEDTRSLAMDSVKVNSLALTDLRPAVESMAKRCELTHLVYGSGFENHVDSLDFLESQWVVLGNPAALFRCFQDKPAFFYHLAALSITHPQTVFSPPNDGDEWLVKPMRGEGGLAIARYDGARSVYDADFYWQRYLAGDVFSVLFAAATGQVKLLGFNRQWAASIDDQEFAFAGIRNHAELSPLHRELLSEWLEKLVNIYPLRGLGSLDFIVHDQECYALEINARIPSGAQLYGQSVFRLHLLACLGVLAEVEQAAPAGYQVILAEKDIVIPVGLAWPKWVVDRPESGVFIGKGRPVCSIIAGGNDAGRVEAQLRRQQIIIENFLKSGL